MEETHDRLLLEWNTKNEKSLDDYAKWSKAKVWWKCYVCNHEWQARIDNRVCQNNSCPNCSGRQEFFLDPETQNRVLQEWSPKNERPFSDYSKWSKTKTWWKCSVCYCEWQTTIGNRVGNKSGCPNCKKLRFRGNTNPMWTGYGEIGGGQWCKIKLESTEARRSRRYKSHTALPFKITIEYAWNLFLKQNRKCALSGEPLTMWGKINGKYTGNASLDRIDSSKGYVDGNVQWIDKKLQHVKTKLSDAEFIAICQKVAAYQVEKLGIPSFKQWATKV
jgi:hypothetical protein